MCISIYTFQRVAPTTHPGTTLVSSSSQTLRFELNTLNLALGGISVLYKTKYPIASGGHSPPDPLLQRSTTVISPLSENPRSPPDSIGVGVVTLGFFCVVGFVPILIDYRVGRVYLFAFCTILWGLSHKNIRQCDKQVQIIYPANFYHQTGSVKYLYNM